MLANMNLCILWSARVQLELRVQSLRVFVSSHFNLWQSYVTHLAL
jgi:hypothetical protein